VPGLFAKQIDPRKRIVEHVHGAPPTFRRIAAGGRASGIWCRVRQPHRVRTSVRCCPTIHQSRNPPIHFPLRA
jgi:hypothetical protein